MLMVKCLEGVVLEIVLKFSLLCDWIFYVYLKLGMWMRLIYIFYKFIKVDNYFYVKRGIFEIEFWKKLLS